MRAKKSYRAEELTKRTSTDRVHGTRFQVDEDGTRNVFATRGFVKVDVDSLQLKIRVSVESTGRVDSVLK